MKKIIGVVCIAIITLSLLGSSYPDSESRVVTGFSVYTDSIPASAINYAEEAAEAQITMLYNITNTIETESIQGPKFDDRDTISIGNGFYKYRINECGELYHNEIIYFPVFQRNTIVCFLSVIPLSSGLWTSSCSTDIAENIVGAYHSGIIFVNDEDDEYYVTSDDITFLKEHDLTSEQDEISKTKWAEDTLRDYSRIGIFTSDIRSKVNTFILTNKLEELSPYDGRKNLQINEYIINDNATGFRGPNGFSWNYENDKALNMDYCLLEQKDHYGNSVAICWAASAGTIIRYRTGNRTIDSIGLCDQYNINIYAPNYTGLSVTDVNPMIHDYGEIQYSIRYTPAIHQTEIRHNINNQFPIYMSAGYYNAVGIRESGHAVTITAYSVVNGVMTLMFWNAAKNGGHGQFETTVYSETNVTTFSMNNKTYIWDRSLLVMYQ